MPIRHAAAVDLDALAATLASAFAEDPMWTWLFDTAANPDGGEGLRSFFGIALKAGLTRGHLYTNADRSAAAVWAPPDVGSLGRPDGEALGALLAQTCGDAGVRRLGALAAGTRGAHPAESHFYLFILGVHGDRRSEGLGAEVIAPVLDLCDREGWPAYLESSNPRNLTFYRRHGFEVTGEIELDGGLTMSSMWRESHREI